MKHKRTNNKCECGKMAIYLDRRRRPKHRSDHYLCRRCHNSYQDAHRTKRGKRVR